MDNIPSGTVSFLFTDIEGSTRMWEARPAEMKQAVERHDMICRAAIEERSGYIFKTVGDAFCAAFGKAGEAIAAAVAIRRALAAVDWGVTPIKVRAGVHTGAAEERGGDYFGQPVNRVARISAAGSGGQILVSLAANELAKDRLPEGCILKDLGLRRLKDLAAPEQLFQLDDTGFTTDFPPLKTLDERPNNLPRTLTSFFGREEEVSRITGLLSTMTLVTLTGPGGTGKTRLALECGAALVDRFRDGVWFVDLTKITDGARLASEVANALGLREDPSVPIDEALAGRLRGSELLLILDNCEHVVEAAAAWAAQAVSSAPGLRILATSREALLVNGETTFRIAPLELPSEAVARDPDSITQFEAVRLFIDRAAMTGRTFRVDEHTAPYIAGICARLEGIPLALELAAAQLRFLSLDDLYRRLTDAFGTLRSTTRGASARQATLRGLFDWSWDLLSTAERRAWYRLALFRGGFSIDGAAALLGEGSDELVEALLLKSILYMGSQETGQSRFNMLETTREYGRFRLDQSGESVDTAAAFVAWLVSLAAQAEPELFTLRSPRILEQLDEELPNLLAGIETAIATGRIAEAALILYDLRSYLLSGRAPLAVVGVFIGTVSDAVQAISGAAQPLMSLVRVQQAVVCITVEDSILQSARAAVAALSAMGLAIKTAQGRLVLIEVLRICQEYAESFRACLDLLAAPPQPLAERIMAEAAIRAGCAIDESASRGKAISVASMLAVGEMLPGNIDAHASPFTVSAALKQWGMELARRIGDAYLLHSGWLGDDNFRCGDLPATRAIIEDTIAFKKEYGLDGELWWSLEQLSVVLTLQGEREAVLTLVADARRFADKLGVPFIQFKAEDMELAVYRALRDWGQAIPLARNMLERYGASDFGLRCRRVLAQCLIADGAFSEGAELLDRYFAEIAAMRLERDDFRLAAARAARRRAEFGLGGDASVAARAAGAALQVIGTQILRFPPEASYRPVVSFALPAGFLVADLAELNWSGYIDEAHAFHDLLAAASAALEWHSFCTLLSEGRSMGLVAIWPISPSETGG